jgi:predicted outer membrane protein
MSTRTAVAGAAALALCVAAPARGAEQPAPPQAGAATKPMPPMLQQDLEKLHASNQAEIQTGKKAEQQGTSADVKQLGTMMDQQHSQMDQELQSLAQRRSISLEGPAYQKELKKLQGAAQAKLGGKTGQAFDRAYADLMVQEHTHDVNKAVPQAISDAQKAGDTELATMLTSVKATLEQHLRAAKQVQATEKKQASGGAGQGVGGAGSSSGGSPQ